MELTFKHINPYLPYGAKFILNEKGIFNLDCEYGTPYEATQPMEISNLVLEDNNAEVELMGKETGWSVGYIGIDEITPLLRPLSDLVKVIEVDGKKILPIFELYKIAQEETDSFERSKISYKTGYSKDIIASLGHFLTKYGKEGFQFNYLIPRQSFSLIHSVTHDSEPIDQYTLMQKMFEWHFDFFNLIPKGLALNINKFNKRK